MAYQALYRKWRPRTFDDVIGQPYVVSTLKNEILSGKTAHALSLIHICISKRCRPIRTHL